MHSWQKLSLRRLGVPQAFEWVCKEVWSSYKPCRVAEEFKIEPSMWFPSQYGLSGPGLAPLAPNRRLYPDGNKKHQAL